MTTIDLSGITASIGSPRYDPKYVTGNRPKHLTITGSGFGNGPTIALFDRFNGNHGDLLTNSRAADIGTWKNTTTQNSGVSYARIYNDLGRGWLAQRDWMAPPNPAQAYLVGIYYAHPVTFTEFRFSQRRWIPQLKTYPGQSTPGILPTGSAWKPTWFGSDGGTDLYANGSGIGAPQANLVIDTYSGGGWTHNSGNGLTPVNSSGGQFGTGFSFNKPCFTSWYQTGNSLDGQYIDICEGLCFDDANHIHQSSNAMNAFGNGTGIITTRNYQGMKVGAWFGWNVQPPTTDYTLVTPLISDVYLAVGPNSRACILASDNPVFNLSSDMYIIPPDSWSDTQIVFSPKPYECLGYYHLILANGTLIQNVTVTAS